MGRRVLRKSPEFDLISRYFSRHQDADVDLSVGDDAAVFSPPPGSRLVFSIDTLVAGRHFPADFPPQYIACRALGSALSDLAAMGASAHHFTLALTIPEYDPLWLESFSTGLFDMASEYGVLLVGGDTSQGPLTISIQVHGLTDNNTLITRAGGQPGDGIYVSGTLGDAAGGLELVQQKEKKNLDDDELYLIERFRRPSPRLKIGQDLRQYAHAGLDISDGFLADLQHLLVSSQLSALVEVENLPISDSLRRIYGEQRALELALSGGDDYELLLCIPPEFSDIAISCGMTRVGRVEPEGGRESIRLTHGSLPYDLPLTTGYSHFE